ncbi:GNAT family N-acetyltransferase [Sinomicrobium weinanense]|uniref:N-acetyltransferase n=1 Tax=Sinomicrobium weinanense TaxID=2842200 RepID=A0A926JRE7_9FLAO|nr:N-acetyltransferase [Sinomicrobium weinanense]MBC9795991.1 N-acetyltransferase [Sinomicrobium weinanense]MBU3122110.1 N-acetyltransferase [Sinomicrobium weinanense]
MSEVAVKDNDFLRQFELRIDGKLAKIEYSSQEKKIFLTKLVMPENFEDHFKDDFIESVLHIVEKRNLRVVPTSPEIARFLRKHKEYKDLLPVGIRI